jgi:PAS domain S-box-containing protein
MGENQLNNSENLFKAIYEESPIGIELYDSNGKLIDLNQACMELFGLSSKDEVKGFDLLDDPNIPKEYLTRLKLRETVKFESSFDFKLVKRNNLYKTAKTGKIYLDVLITPLFLGDNNSISNYLVQIQDISDHKIAESKCKRGLNN